MKTKEQYVKENKHIIHLCDQSIKEFKDRRAKHHLLSGFEAELFESGYKENEVEVIIDYFIEVAGE